MKRLLIVEIMLLGTWIVSACGLQSNPVQPTENGFPVAITVESQLATPRAVSMMPTPTPALLAFDISSLEPKPGRAAVTGRLISTVTQQPISNTPIRLAEIFYADETKDPATAAWALNNASSPYALTNEQGFFVFPDVEARDYVIFVGDIIDRYTVVTKEEDGFPRTYSFEADRVTQLDDVMADYAP